MSKQLTHISAIVSGGASGLGAAVAERIINSGGEVVILDTNTLQGNNLVNKFGSPLHYIETDVASDQSVLISITEAISCLGTCTLLVNCAGIGHSQRVLGKLGPMNTKDFTRIVDVNLNGSFRICHAIIQHMQNNPLNEHGQRGVIVNTASIAAFEGQIGQSGYAASKGGIVSLTLPLAREFAHFGVRVMAIAPGIFDTPMFHALADDVQAELLSQVPFPCRAGQPQEFAALVQHIYENPMLNGEVIRLDGALRMNT